MRTSAAITSSAVGTVSGANVTNVNAIADQMAQSYGVGLTGLALLTTVLLLTHTVSQIPGGRIADRYGALPLARASLLLIVVGNVCLMIVPVFGLALVLRAAVGLGTGAGFVAGSQLIRRAGGQAFAQGVYGGIGIGATGLALAVVPQLEPALAWRAPYVMVAVMATAALLVTAVVRREPSDVSRSLEQVSGSLVRDERLQRLATMHAVSLLSVVVGAWTSVFFVRNLGVTSGAAGLIGSLALLGGIITRPGGGWLLNRRPDLVRVMLAASLIAGSLATLLIATAHSVALAIVGTAVLGLAAGVPFAPSFFGAGHIRPDAPGASVGLVNAAGNGLVMLGTPVLGLTFSLSHDGRLGFVVVGLLWLLAIAAMPRSKDFAPVPSLGALP